MKLAFTIATRRLPLAARRAYRLALTTSLVLALSYGLGVGIPFIAPLFAVILSAKPAPPPGPKKLLLLLIVVAVSLGVGIVLGPLLQKVPLAALVIIAVGLTLSNRLAIQPGKAAVGTLLALGFTVIAATSSISPSLGSLVISALVAGIALAVVGQWLVYPFFPEDSAPPEPVNVQQAREASWLSWRATLIVLPAFVVTLTNPLVYLPLTVKSILLGRESSQLSLSDANREMIGSTLLGGFFAVLLWSCLSLSVSLWFYFFWVFLATLYMASRAYGAIGSRHKTTFWVSTLVTMIILLGAAVQDSANGKDVYQAFFVRIMLFLAVALYATMSMAALEWIRRRMSAPENSQRGLHHVD